jgi:hypothetical protein
MKISPKSGPRYHVLRRGSRWHCRYGLAARIQSGGLAGTAWTRRRIRRQHYGMPLDLTDLELETAARACRGLAYQEEQAAKRIDNPGMRGPIENTAKRAPVLAEKFEAARKEAKPGCV